MYEKQLSTAIKASELGKRVLLEYVKNGFKVVTKEDGSPVTDADIEANKVIVEYLKKEYPDYAILSEELKDDQDRFNKEFVWVIDPLDGTSNFIRNSSDFTINIALVRKGKPVVGVVNIPASNEIYYASHCGGAFYSINNQVKEIHVNRKKKDLTVLISLSHHIEEDEKKISEYGELIVNKKGVGAAIKPCLIARGDAELSFRKSNDTKEWDTCAPQIIVKEAGGYFLDWNGKWITYNKKDVKNIGGYVIANKKKNIIF